MFKNIIESIDGYELVSILTMLFFLIFFGFIIYQVIKIDKSFIKYMSDMPLNSDDKINSDKNK